MPRPPMLDPKRDLVGATPETLARALLRRVEPLRAGRRKKVEKAPKRLTTAGPSLNNESDTGGDPHAGQHSSK